VGYEARNNNLRNSEELKKDCGYLEDKNSKFGT
jgi:hypothetical protein